MKIQTKILSFEGRLTKLRSVIDGVLILNEDILCLIMLAMEDLNGLVKQSITMLGQAISNVSYKGPIQALLTPLNDNQANHLLKDKVELFMQKQNKLFRGNLRMIGIRLCKRKRNAKMPCTKRHDITNSNSNHFEEAPHFLQTKVMES